MKKLLLIFVIAVIALTSCEKVIDIDLNLADPALVIEGKILKDSLAQVFNTKNNILFYTGYSAVCLRCRCDHSRR